MGQDILLSKEYYLLLTKRSVLLLTRSFQSRVEMK